MDKWTTTELRAAVDEYVRLLKEHRAGREISKADAIRALIAGPLKLRTKGSVEYRFANISAVLEEAGKDWLQGYVPARNVGPTNSKAIRIMLTDHGLI